MTKLEYRAADLKTEEGTRTLTARAVPYGEWTELYPGLLERFEPGALHASPLGIKLRLEHSETIGVVTSFENREDGAYISARISETRAGDDAYTLLKDGALRSMSIGFRTEAAGTTVDIIDDIMHISRKAAELIEVSLVSFPAYEGAAVESFRSAKEGNTLTMEDTQNVELAELRGQLEDNTRAISKLSQRIDTADSAEPIPYRSFGEYVKAYADGDELAQRAYTGVTTTADKTVRPAWMNRIVDRMTAKMRVTNLFTHAFDLPATGMSLEFPVFGSDSFVVGKQAKEGDDLPYGKIELSTGSAPINTYGGYARVSRQIIDRSSPVYLSTLFTRMALHYAKTIEAATLALLTATVDARLGETKLKTAASGLTSITVDQLISLITDAAELFDEGDFPLDGLLVTKDVFTHLATLDQAPKALSFQVDSKTQGTVSLPDLTGQIASIPVSLAIPGTGKAAFYSREAIEIHESAGAPMRLQAENVVNLSNDFSVYGYVAHFAPDVAALVPVGVGGAGE